jgi:hypothetical protein
MLPVSGECYLQAPLIVPQLVSSTGAAPQGEHSTSQAPMSPQVPGEWSGSGIRRA